MAWAALCQRASDCHLEAELFEELVKPLSGIRIVFDDENLHDCGPSRFPCGIEDPD